MHLPFPFISKATYRTYILTVLPYFDRIWRRHCRFACGMPRCGTSKQKRWHCGGISRHGCREGCGVLTSLSSLHRRREASSGSVIIRRPAMPLLESASKMFVPHTRKTALNHATLTLIILVSSLVWCPRFETKETENKHSLSYKRKHSSLYPPSLSLSLILSPSLFLSFFLSLFVFLNTEPYSAKNVWVFWTPLHSTWVSVCVCVCVCDYLVRCCVVNQTPSLCLLPRCSGPRSGHCAGHQQARVLNRHLSVLSQLRPCQPDTFVCNSPELGHGETALPASPPPRAGSPVTRPNGLFILKVLLWANHSLSVICLLSHCDSVRGVCVCVGGLPSVLLIGEFP